MTTEKFVNSQAYAEAADQADPLKSYRDRFYFPRLHGRQALYFTGNSLGLQPKSTQDYVLNELEDWATFGVEGHFHARNPWFSYHELLTPATAGITGALNSEVVVMNQLTVNLHLLMVSFYRPTSARYKIICEAKAFPSDQYAIETQVRFHGFEPEKAIIEIEPRSGSHIIETKDILEAINLHKNELALVLIGGVNYYTGQVFNFSEITRAAHEAGAMAGFDLAHATGNIPLQLHNWGVDFACWCGYKYLNAGPGGVSGVFVHERHHQTALPRFAGWWGHDKESRFKMEKGFVPIPGAEGWQLSNAPVLSMAALKASLDIFGEAGMEALHRKSVSLTNYLEFIFNDINQSLSLQSGINNLEIITPPLSYENGIPTRGCQLSVIAHGQGRALYNRLLEASVIADWREPNVIRLAPAPLYNSFTDVWEFGRILQQLLTAS